MIPAHQPYEMEIRALSSYLSSYQYLIKAAAEQSKCCELKFPSHTVGELGSLWKRMEYTDTDELQIHAIKKADT